MNVYTFNKDTYFQTYVLNLFFLSVPCTYVLLFNVNNSFC